MPEDFEIIRENKEQNNRNNILNLSKIDNKRVYNNTTNITNYNTIKRGGLISLLVSLIKSPFWLLKEAYILLIIKTNFKKNMILSIRAREKYNNNIRNQKKYKKAAGEDCFL